MVSKNKQLDPFETITLSSSLLKSPFMQIILNCKVVFYLINSEVKGKVIIPYHVWNIKFTFTKIYSLPETK